MNPLSMVEARLPAGFRFHPRDDELVCEYLSPKVSGGGLYSCPAAMVDVDLNNCEPWDLPGMALVGKKEWYFFSLKDRKYATGHRTNRSTLSGYWKATGKDRRVTRRGLTVGMRKTLVFYIGRAPKGKKTEWVMHEFRIEGLHDPPKFNFKEDWVLCRVFYKSGTMLTKPSTENYYDDTSSSTLPPLSDACILFNQSLPHPEGFEQVPCFSNFTSISPLNYPLVERSMQTKSFAHLGALPMASDERVVAAVVNQFTKLEGSQRSSEVCLLNTGHPSVWNPF